MAGFFSITSNIKKVREKGERLFFVNRKESQPLIA